MATRRSLAREQGRPVTDFRTRTFEWEDPGISADAARKLTGNQNL